MRLFREADAVAEREKPDLHQRLGWLFGTPFISSVKHPANGFASINVVIGSVALSDLALFFNPEPDEPVLLSEQTRFPQLLATLGLFASGGQARKNGWDKEIPFGFSEWVFKKQRRIVFILRAQPENKTQRLLRDLNFFNKRADKIPAVWALWFWGKAKGRLEHFFKAVLKASQPVLGEEV